MTDTITLPRSVVEQALEALDEADLLMEHRQNIELRRSALVALRAALEQPQNHVPDTENMVSAGWKLVPVEPNCSMVLAGERSLEQHDFLRLDSAYRAMLDAAPQPPTTKQSSAAQQPQGEQEPVAWIRGSGLEMLKLENGGRATVYASDGMSNHSQPLYTRPQPKREPLTDEQWLKLWTGRTGQRLKPGPDRDRLLRRFRFSERAHGIGGEE